MFDIKYFLMCLLVMFMYILFDRKKSVFYLMKNKLEKCVWFGMIINLCVLLFVVFNGCNYKIFVILNCVNMWRWLFMGVMIK